MWGNIVLEYVYSSNFHNSLPDTNNKILISISHWQYWWWFWFTSITSLYYFIIIKYIFSRNIKFYPKINTSLKSHGKWGDLIVCIIPISWCLNILTHSHLLLRLHEWQVDSSYLTLRVRGKQWYWIYKIDKKDIYNFASNYSNYNLIGNDYHVNSYNKNNYIINSSNDLEVKKVKNNDLMLFKNFKPIIFENGTEYLFLNNKKLYNFLLFKNKLVFGNKTIFNNNDFTYSNGYRSKNNLSSYISLNTYDESNGILQGEKKNIIKDSYKNYFVFSQKPTSDFYKNTLFVESDVNIENYDFVFENSYYNKNKLTKTNGILVLPINTNINVITNSFDVIHSWFIPGLGFKLDCIPGRSTHHTLYIKNSGIYFGHCAEVCGRLHHHMPIRICGVSVEHFIVWLNHTFLKKKI